MFDRALCFSKSKESAGSRGGMESISASFVFVKPSYSFRLHKMHCNFISVQALIYEVAHFNLSCAA